MPVPAAASDGRCHTAAESQEMYSSSVISSTSVCWAELSQKMLGMDEILL